MVDWTQEVSRSLVFIRSLNNASAQRRRSSAKSTAWVHLTEPERGELIVHLWGS